MRMRSSSPVSVLAQTPESLERISFVACSLVAARDLSPVSCSVRMTKQHGNQRIDPGVSLEPDLRSCITTVRRKSPLFPPMSSLFRFLLLTLCARASRRERTS